MKRREHWAADVVCFNDGAAELARVEHLPTHLRCPPIKEMTRVADRVVVIGSPCDLIARVSDQLLAWMIAISPRMRQ